MFIIGGFIVIFIIAYAVECILIKRVLDRHDRDTLDDGRV